MHSIHAHNMMEFCSHPPASGAVSPTSSIAEETSVTQSLPVGREAESLDEVLELEGGHSHLDTPTALIEG